MTIVMSQIMGDVRLGYRRMLSIRSGRPRSGRMEVPASLTATAASSTARGVIGWRAWPRKSLPAEATMRPPAERPTKNMKKRMYWPHITVLRIPVTTRPVLYWWENGAPRPLAEGRGCAPGRIVQVTEDAGPGGAGPDARRHLVLGEAVDAEGALL